MAITPLPTPPSRSDPENFADRADAFLAALPDFGTEANALSVEVNNNRTTAQQAASAASDSETNAAASETNAAAFAYNANVSALNAATSAELAATAVCTETLELTLVALLYSSL